MKTLSVIVVVKENEDCVSIQSRLCANCDANVEVHFVKEIDALNEVFHGLESDYALIMTSDFELAYDDALGDALAMSEGNDLACYGIYYEEEHGNKYDVHWRHPLSSPSLSYIIEHPSNFLAVVFSKTQYSSFSFKGKNIYEALVGALILQLCQGKKCEFVAVDILKANVRSSTIDTEVDKSALWNRFYYENPILAPDYRSRLEAQYSISEEEAVVLGKLKNSLFFRTLMAFREILKKCGYYRIKASFKQKQYLKKTRKNDAERKIEIEKKIEQLPLNMLKQKGDDSDIVVSLTTHGKRFEESAPYAIYSLFAQTILPNRIVISVDQDAWNESNLPPLIKRLQQSGLEVLFCRDVRSHTKLLPALAKYNANPIITVDDDMYYDSHMIEELLTAYAKSDKRTVLCRQGVFPKKKNGNYVSYMEWIESGILKSKADLIKQKISPFGVSGVIYPPKIFDNEVFNDSVFLKLAPHTDDIWFWLMEMRCGVNTQLIADSSYKQDVSVSMIEYLVESESTALYFQNCFNGRNDAEMFALLDYYGIQQSRT